MSRILNFVIVPKQKSLMEYASLFCIKFDFGIPLEDIFPSDDIHPRLHNLFRQTELAIYRSPLTLYHILKYPCIFFSIAFTFFCSDLPGSLKRRLSLKHDLIDGHLEHKKNLNPTSFVWLLRHFLGLLPLPLFPKYTNGQICHWNYLAAQCRLNGTERNHELEWTIFCCIDRLPQANVLMIHSLMSFFKKILAKYKFSARIYRKNLTALVNYFCSSLFVRPYMPGFVFKRDKLYFPLLYYLLANWSQFTRQMLIQLIALNNKNVKPSPVPSVHSLSKIEEENICDDNEYASIKNYDVSVVPAKTSLTKEEQKSLKFTKLSMETLEIISITSTSLLHQREQKTIFEDKNNMTDFNEMINCGCQTSSLELVDQESKTKHKLMEFDVNILKINEDVPESDFLEEESKQLEISYSKISSNDGQKFETEAMVQKQINKVPESCTLNKAHDFQRNSENEDYYDQPTDIKCPSSETAIYNKYKNVSKHYSLKRKFLKINKSFTGVLDKMMSNQFKFKEESKTKLGTHKYSLLEEKTRKEQFSPNLNNFSTKLTPHIKYKKLLTL